MQQRSDHWRTKPADDRGDKAGEESDCRPQREVLVALLRPRVLGDERDLHDADCHLPGTEGYHSHEHERQITWQEGEERDRYQGHPAGHHFAPADPVGNSTGRQGHEESCELRGGHEPADRPAQPDRLEVQVEIDPVEAESRAEDDRSQQEEARVLAEAREAPGIPGQGAVHTAPHAARPGSGAVPARIAARRAARIDDPSDGNEHLADAATDAVVQVRTSAW